MTDSKAEPQRSGKRETVSRHGKRAEERRKRQAEALRENLKKRKQQIRSRTGED